MYKHFGMKSLKWIFCTAMCLNIAGMQAQHKDNRFDVSKNLDVFNAIVKEMEMFYVDSLNIDQTVGQGINAMLSGLDPYTKYYPEKDMDELKLMTSGEYGGIGAGIAQRDSFVFISEPFEGMPAALAGLKAGDYLLEVNGVDVRKKSSSDVSALLKGAPNTPLKIKYQRPGEKKPKEIELTRKLVVVDQVTYYGVRGDSTGYIYLSGFTDKSAREVKNAFIDLKKQGINKLVLDLRGNPGGIVEGAVQIVSLFVPKGEVVLSTKGKQKQWDRTYRTASEPLDTVIPIAVLVDNNTASAGEIVSGALQDLDRAILVGNRTFGKGLVQTTRELPYDGTLKITMYKYYIPSGRCIQEIDYAHRGANGEVVRIPDSLTTVFHTSKGRPVRDGGGVSPDFPVKLPETPTILYYLIMDNMVFDYVTGWVQKHKTIAPAEAFVFTEKDYEDFRSYLKSRNFTYDRQSEKVLKNLKEVAEFEGYMEGASDEYKALEAKLTPDLDRDLDRFEKQIRAMIASEIVQRYYFQRGEVIQSLKDDKVLEKALEVLNDPQLYRQTLSAPQTEAASGLASAKNKD